MDGSSQQSNSEQALQRAIWDSNEILVSAATIFTLHKHTLTLNRTKLVAEKRSGLGSAEVLSVRVEDLLNSNAIVGPFWGSIKITTKFTKPGEPYTIGFFLRKDALSLKRIIQGHIIALQRSIDLSAIPTVELRTLLYKLGEDDHSIQ